MLRAFLILVCLGVAAPVAAQSANLWVDTDGGTCTRTGGAGATYVDAAACSSMDAAYNAATSGDTARMVAGTYGQQGTVGNDTKTFTIIGAGPTLTVIDSGSTNGAYNTLNFSDNLTIRSVGVTGDYPIVAFNNSVNDATWEDFRLTGRAERYCSPGSDEPLKIQADDADGFTIANITLRDGYIGAFYGHSDGMGGGCVGDNFHLEQIRVGGDVNGLLIDGVFFENCNDSGSMDGCTTASILITAPGGGSRRPSNVTIINSSFGSTHGAQPSIHLHEIIASCSNYLFAYNTFVGANPLVIGNCASVHTIVLVGNTGSRAVDQDCSLATWTKNVWQYSTGTPCGTDTRVNGPNFETGNLNINTTTRKLETGSPSIDAAETPGASDYCTGAVVNSIDFENGTRPSSTVCDAGWDEFGADAPSEGGGEAPRVRIRIR